MVILTLVIELSEGEEQASQVIEALTKSYISGTGCVPVSGFTVRDIGLGNHLSQPLTFTTAETKESS